MSEKFLFHPEAEQEGGVAVVEPAQEVEGVSAEHVVEEYSVDPELRRQMEENRAKAFAHITAFNQSIAEHEHAVAMLAEIKDESLENKDKYEKELQYLEVQRAKQAQVAEFEEKLWGNSLEDHAKGKKALLDAIADIETPEDVLALFDRWGALPGANTVDLPVYNRESVASFLEKIQNRTDIPDFHGRMEKLFPNKRLREKVYGMAITQMPDRALSPEVWDHEGEDEILSPNQDAVSQRIAENANRVAIDREARVREKKERVIDMEQKDHVDPIVEMDELARKERLLVEAQKVIQSKMFKYAPFLMKLTPSGREKLKTIERAGFTLNTRRASPETLQMAGALKLKAIRERYSQLTGGVTQNFADDLNRRKVSEEAVSVANMYGTSEDIQRNREEKEATKNKDTRRNNLQKIQRVLSVEPVKRQRPKATVAPDDGFRIGVDHTVGEDGKFKSYTSVRSKPNLAPEAIVQDEQETEVVETPPIVVEPQESSKERKARKEKELVAIFERKQREKKKRIEKAEGNLGRKVTKTEARKVEMKARRAKKKDIN